MRRGGTQSALASADWLRPSGRTNSSRRISPGVGFGNQSASVVVDDFDIGRTSFPPLETDAPLVVDANRILPLPFALERNPVRPQASRPFLAVQIWRLV